MRGSETEEELHVQIQNKLIEDLNQSNEELRASESRYRSSHV